MDANTLANKLSAVIINPLIELIFAAGLLVFIWGLVEFLWGLSADTEKKESGKKHMLWGILGMFIMVAAYSILRIIGTTVNTPVSL